MKFGNCSQIGIIRPWNGFWDQLIFFLHKSGSTLRNFYTLPKIDMAKHGNLLSIRPPNKKWKKCHFATILLTILIHQRGCPGKSQSLWLDCSKWGYKLHLFNFVSNPPLFKKIWSPLFTDHSILCYRADISIKILY